MIFGDKVKPQSGAHSVVGIIEVSARGNIVLRVGHRIEPGRGGWQQTEHVVMTPEEARSFAAEIFAATIIGR